MPHQIQECQNGSGCSSHGRPTFFCGNKAEDASVLSLTEGWVWYMYVLFSELPKMIFKALPRGIYRFSVFRDWKNWNSMTGEAFYSATWFLLLLCCGLWLEEDCCFHINQCSNSLVKDYNSWPLEVISDLLHAYAHSAMALVHSNVSDTSAIR